MNPELHDPERSTSQRDPRLTVQLKAEAIEDQIKDLIHSLNELQQLISRTSGSDVSLSSSQMAEMRVIVVQAAQRLSDVLFIPMVIKAIYGKGT